MKRNKICVVMPTRSRPLLQLRAVSSILTTSSGRADVIMAVDSDDARCLSICGPQVSTHVLQSRKPMLHILNEVVMANLPYYDVFGFTGDDVVYETPNWDGKILGALRHTVGVAYGDDGIQHENLPTHPWFSAALVRTLGRVCNLGQRHYFFDNYLKSIFKPLGLLFYLPDVSTRHLHHSVTPGAYDKVYRDAETGYYESDRVAFETYRSTRLEEDIAKVKSYAEINALIAAQAVTRTDSRTP